MVPPGPSSTRMMGEGPSGVNGEQVAPISDGVFVNAAQLVFDDPGPIWVIVIDSAGLLGKFSVTSTGYAPVVDAAVGEIVVGVMRIGEFTLSVVPLSYVNVESAETAAELLVDVLFVELSLNVTETGVIVTVPVPPIWRVPVTSANDGAAVNKMRPKLDPIKPNRAKAFIGSSWRALYPSTNNSQNSVP